MPETNQSIMPVKAAIELILKHLSYLHPVSEELKNAILKSAFLISLDKNEQLQNEGEYCRYLYFIVEGALIGYTSKRKKNITTFISKENEFVTSISGMYGQFPSKESIKAVLPTQLVGISTSLLLDWFNIFPETNILMRKILENYYQQATERAIIMRLGTAREKFLYYLSTYPENVQRIPLNIIAYFLDIKLKTLIKIKSQYDLDIEDVDLKSQFLQIKKHVEDNQSYKKKGLTISQLAAELLLSAHRLSYIINNYSNVNYTRFINNYRVEYVKERLNDSSEWQHFTLEALGFEAGFSSRSSFFSAFKEITGYSPGIYANCNSDGS